MNSSLQTQRYLSVESKVGGISYNPLAFELGWSDVAAGLSKVLWGYGVSVVMVLVAVGLAFTAATADPSELVGRNPNVAKLWLILGGAGIVTILGILSFFIVLSGKFKCAVNAPDRHGARWLIYGCILCLVMALVVNILGGMAVRRAGAEFVQKHRTEIAAGAEGNEQFHRAFLTSVVMPAMTVYIISLALNLATTVFFVLFLRAVGVCFYHSGLTKSAEFYLMFSFLLMGVTGMLIFGGDQGEGDLILLAGLAAGWVFSLIWYIAMIVMARGIILKGMVEARRKEVYT